MARKKKIMNKRLIESYEHKGKKRLNNPPLGLVTPDTDPHTGQKKKTYTYNPQLVWAGMVQMLYLDPPFVNKRDLMNRRKA